MRGMTFGGERTVEFIEVPDPTPGPGEVVLEMKASGICGSDLHMYRGPRGMNLLGATSTDPLIRGHEPCGTVAAVGPGVDAAMAKVGDRVMVHHYYGCGACKHCRQGWSQLCERQRPIVYGIGEHGGHAPYLKVPARTLVGLPDSLSFEAGAAIACGSGTSYAALRRLNVTGGDTIAVFGQGPVGLAGTQFAAAMGARVIALDISDDRLDLARKLGADVGVNVANSDPVEAIKELTGGEGADLALEASGAGPARAAAIGCLRIWGACALVGVGGPPAVEIGSMMTRQITVIGSWTFSSVGQMECAAFAADHDIAVDGIFTDRWSLEQADEAYAKVDAQNTGKGVFVW